MDGNIHMFFFTIIVTMFAALGLFGNVNIVVAAFRSKRADVMRTKIGLLMTVTTVLHTVCLLSEFINLFDHWRFKPMPRDVCFNKIFIYLFAVIMQSGMFLSMSLDLLFSVGIPIRHRVWPKRAYVICMSIPPFIIAVVTTFLCYLVVDNKTIYMCCLPTVIPQPYVSYVGYSLLLTNIASVWVAICAVVQVTRRASALKSSHIRSSGSSSSSEKKIAHKMVSIVSVFIGSWFVCVLVVHVLTVYNIGGRWNDSIKIYVVVLAFITYSKTYYVLYFRFPRYRRVYREQLHWLTGGKLFNKDWTDKTNSKTILRNDTLDLDSSFRKNNEEVFV